MILSFEDFDHALSLTESGDNPNAPLGDGGRAAFRRQMHPVFYEDPRWAVPIPHGTDPTWDETCEWRLRRFWEWAVAHDIDDLDAACGFNLHGAPIAGSAAQDPAYAERFRKAAGL